MRAAVFHELKKPLTVETVKVGSPSYGQVIDSKDIATHRVLFGRVTGLRIGDNLRPLIYHDRDYHRL